MTQPAPPTASASNGFAALRAVLHRHLRQWWPIPLVALLAAIVERLWRAPEPVMWTALPVVPVSAVVPLALHALWPSDGQRFVLTRPAPWWAWWGGQVASTLLLLGLCVGLLGVPAFLTGASLERASPTLLAEVQVLVIFFGLALTFLSAVRAGAVGSALAVIAVAAVVGWSPLLLTGNASSSDALGRVHLLVAGLGLVSCVLASAAAVAAGRGDPRRAVGAAAVVWCLFAVPVVAWSAWRWAYPVPPPAVTDLLRVDVARASDDGRWLHVGGFTDAEGRRRPDFLVHADSGRWQRLPAVWNRLVAFDPGGGRVAWVEYGGTGGPNPVLAIAALDDAGGLVVERRHVLEFRQPTLDLVVLRGAHVALVAPDWVQLRNAESGAVLSTAVRSGPQRLATITADGALVFVRDAVTGSFDARDAEVVRLREGRGEDVLMTVGDLARGDTLTLSGDGRQLLVCRVGRRPAAMEPPRTIATLYDVERGTVSASIDVPQVMLSTGFLADGRAVVASRLSNRRVLVAAFDDEAPATTTEVGRDAGAVLLGGEVASGVVALGITTSAADTTQTVFVDVNAARMVRSRPGVAPLVRFRFPLDEDAWRGRAPRQVFFIGPQGILAIDDGSDEPRVVVESASAASWLAPAR